MGALVRLPYYGDESRPTRDPRSWENPPPAVGGVQDSVQQPQWVTHEASVQHAPGLSGVGGGGVLEPPTFSKNPEEFSSPSQNSGSHLPVILGKSGNLHHQTASFAGAPIMTRERCRVTQPRARINVSCSRAGQKGATEASKRGQRRPAKDSE